MKSFAIRGLNHLGLVVLDIEIARKWFVETLGCRLVDDRGDLLFIMCGEDILAIKTPQRAVNKPEHGGESSLSLDGKAGFQVLDHYGFYADDPESVDVFAAHVVAHGAEVIKGPYDRSDGRSVYFRDPCGNIGEYLFYKPAR